SLAFWHQQKIPASSSGLLALALVAGVPRIHLPASAGASREMDGRDKPDHDNVGINRQSLNTGEAANRGLKTSTSVSDGPAGSWTPRRCAWLGCCAGRRG